MVMAVSALLNGLDSMPMKVSKQTLQEVQEAFRRWEQEVGATKLQPSTKKTYIGHPRHFVRWLAGDFTPGARTG